MIYFAMDRLRSFGFLLKDASRLYVQRFDQRARMLGLTLPQCKAIVHLARHEGISQAQLSELTDIEPMNLVRILDRMETDGWLERRNDPADRRARRLYLKSRARPLLERIGELADATRAEAFAGIPPSQAELLIDLLEKVQSNITSLEPLTAGTSK
jgi:DNA-binding MarR family transcriptional regulator